METNTSFSAGTILSQDFCALSAVKLLGVAILRPNFVRRLWPKGRALTRAGQNAGRGTTCFEGGGEYIRTHTSFCVNIAFILRNEMRSSFQLLVLACHLWTVFYTFQISPYSRWMKVGFRRTSRLGPLTNAHFIDFSM